MQFSISECEHFTISLEAKNQGETVLNPELHRAQLLINDQPSMAWGLAVGNGLRPEKWYALPPGEMVSMTWSTMGPSLFPESGDYTLVLQLDEQETEPIQVKVLDE